MEDLEHVIEELSSQTKISPPCSSGVHPPFHWSQMQVPLKEFGDMVMAGHGRRRNDVYFIEEATPLRGGWCFGAEKVGTETTTGDMPQAQGRMKW